MASHSCPACKAKIPDRTATCPNCGKTPPGPAETLPIKRLGGKVQAAATVFLAVGIIATVLGAWWGPALLFPGVVVFIMGRFL